MRKENDYNNRIINRMNNNVLVFHIGMPKTGTTSLQYFLYDNAHILEEYGWYYPDTASVVRGGNTVFAKKNGAGVVTADFRFDVQAENWKDMWKCIYSYLEKGNVIISSEDISIRFTNNILSAAKENYDNIKVVVYLRRQDRYMESLWCEHIKCTRYNTKWINEWKEEYIDNSETTRIDTFTVKYFDWLESISSIVGKENVIVRVYEKEQFEGARKDVVSDFLCTLGMKDFPWEKATRDERLNKSLSGELLDLKRIMNQQLSLLGPVYNAKVLEQIEKISRKQEVSSKEGYFNVQERASILESSKRQNELIATEYLHREDGQLFYDENLDIPQYVSQFTSYEEHLMQKLISLYCEQSQELELLKIMSAKGNRKMACFGAGYVGELLLEKNCLPIEVFVDNSKSKTEGGVWKQREIIWTGEIENWKEFFFVIACTRKYKFEIEEQLQQHGLLKDKDYIYALDYFRL